MSKLSMVTTVLVTGLSEAFAKDEQFSIEHQDHNDAGFDISAGMFGVHVSEWLRETAETFESNPFTTPSELGLEKQKVIALKTENETLKECIGNYETAIKESQKSTLNAEKKANITQKKLDRLIKLVTHNAKNSDTILSQL